MSPPFVIRIKNRTMKLTRSFVNVEMSGTMDVVLVLVEYRGPIFNIDGFR